MDQLLTKETAASDTQLHQMLCQLEAAGILLVDGDARWHVNRDLEVVSLLDLYRAGNFHLPLNEPLDLDEQDVQPCDAAFMQTMESFRTENEANLERSLESLFKECALNGAGDRTS